MKPLKVYSTQEIDEKKKFLSPLWEYKNGRLCLTTTCLDFEAAITLINKIAELADKHNHHPKIENEYALVSLSLWTHDYGGITQRDFDLAHAIDDLKEISS